MRSSDRDDVDCHVDIEIINDKRMDNVSSSTLIENQCACFYIPSGVPVSSSSLLSVGVGE